MSNKKPYFIAEIGINHNSDIQIVKKLIDAANACNWDCVKFQKRNPDVCVPEAQKNKIKETPWGKLTYLQYKHKMEFNKLGYDIIDNYCYEKPIHWAASIWDQDSLNFINSYTTPFIKIPSALITNLELVENIALTKNKVIISTGMSTLKETDRAVNKILKHNNDLVIMHCNSSYPAPIEDLNLNMIPILKKRYGCIVGYSGHELDLEPTVIAVSLGAEYVERHITLDHNMWGTDQKASLEVHAMDMLYKRCKDVIAMLGDGIKKITKEEMKVREKLRK